MATPKTKPLTPEKDNHSIAVLKVTDEKAVDAMGKAAAPTQKPRKRPAAKTPRKKTTVKTAAPDKRAEKGDPLLQPLPPTKMAEIYEPECKSCHNLCPAKTIDKVRKSLKGDIKVKCMHCKSVNKFKWLPVT